MNVEHSANVLRRRWHSMYVNAFGYTKHIANKSCNLRALRICSEKSRIMGNKGWRL